MRLEERKRYWVVISDDGKRIWMITSNKNIAKHFIENNT